MNKKCIITGASKGVGKAIAKFLIQDNWSVLDISRSSGYDLNNLEVVSQIVEMASDDCDLFINSAAVFPAQRILLSNLYDKVDKLITIGSIAGDFYKDINDDYSRFKFELSDLNNRLSVLPTANDLLMLKLSVLEDAVITDCPVHYTEVVDIIKFWLLTPSVKTIETKIKFTPYTILQLKKRYNINVG